jgi:lysophospholipase L1-like esterase
MKTLVCLGDSWPQGGELRDQTKGYGHLIKTKLNFDQFYNYGSGGASNEDSLLQLQQFVQDHYDPAHETTVVVHLTNPARSMFWPDRQNWVNGQPADLRALFLYFHELDDFRSSLVITALQKWCQKLGITDFYFSGWVRYDQWLPMVDTDKIWAQGKETASDWFGASDHNGEHLINVANNPYIRPNHCHPNEVGHQFIAEKLVSWISKKQ